MPLKAVVESVFHVEHFRNIDLFNQGFYALAVKMYHEEGDQKVYSYPLEISLSKTAEKMTRLTDGFLDDTEKLFFTRSFLIRYFDEEVEINDLCTFRAEVDAKDGFLNTEFFIEAELYYIELKSMGDGKLSDKEKIIVEKFPLKPVSKAKLKVIRFCNGISEYFPIVFEGQYFSQFNCTIHSCLIDIKYRPYENNYIEDLSQYNLEYLGNLIVNMYERMTGKYKRYLSECLEPEQHEELGDKVNVPQIKLPGEEQSKEPEETDESSRRKPDFGPGEEYCISSPQSPAMGSDNEDFIDDIENISEEKTDTKIPVLKNKKKKLMNKNTGNFGSRFNISDPLQMTERVSADFSYISFQLCALWNCIVECIRIEPKFILEFLKVDYDQKVREKWCENVYRKIIMTKDFTCHTDEDFREIHSKFLQDRLESGYKERINNLAVQDQLLWGKPELHPMLIEHCYQRNDPFPSDFETEADSERDCPYEGYYTGCHLIVFAHGFQGSSTDMKVLKNYFSIIHPDAVFLLSDANHNNTENCIEDMGEKLAEEITKKIESYCPDSLGRLSFIGHSMGGIIIRAALPHLEKKYKEQMFTFISLSSPHLGYMYNASKIISTGMWIMKQWKKSKSLAQLSMTDAKDMEDTFLYKLSCQEGLNWFKNVVLISSYKDSYAPFDSARIQNCTQATKDSKYGEFYMKMANNILEKLSTNSIHRIDVNFMINEKNMDTFIGRAAHIHFLENQYFMRILSHRFLEFFD
ncbi:unnamed protein product [Moneuplotes crassus]|uniref:DUF676 domain-containing protein n=2 Tax=Euplotes crassus TaxID=5936 RepID=A0AAD1YAQ1_EUPCR|nr:unnamed protein product [Moneuplotes crassus]